MQTFKNQRSQFYLLLLKQNSCQKMNNNQNKTKMWVFFIILPISKYKKQIFQRHKNKVKTKQFVQNLDTSIEQFIYPFWAQNVSLALFCSLTSFSNTFVS